MNKELTLLFAGFGGQGVLFGGKVAAYAGLVDERQVSWLPSYGPEMRGGTANCSVTISDSPVGSPLILKPNALIALNLPSYDKFIDSVVPGGTVIINSALINKKCERDDINVSYIPVTSLAEEEGLSGLANLIALGKLLAIHPFSTKESVFTAIEKCVPPSKMSLLDGNKKALTLGIQF